ncbi:Ger(x)C family spore germination protein [Sutcliffiella cohnii]|uniref:Ger(x)C family spore germination protein n=1 Tax=Sutcliffiella cohnii TaxID=33932 RepID=UPI002E1ACC52|nr:Ger(x)C family spore germination protein [Sutcliffiella cohnii]
MRGWKFIIVCLLLFPLSGCWDRGEITQFAFPVVLGIDEGEDGLIEITMQIANARGAAPKMEASSGTEPSEIITISAPDLLSAREMANISVTKDIRYSHVKNIVIGEKLARSRKFPSIMEATLRDRQFRRDINIVISRERAADFIRNNNPQLEERPHKFFAFMLERWEQTGLMPEATINQYFKEIDGKEGLFLSIYATSTINEPKVKEDEDYIAGEVDLIGGNPTQMIGSAVFKNGRMVGVLSGEETRHSLLLRPYAKIDTIQTNFRDPNDPSEVITVRMLKNESPKVKINMEKEKGSILVVIPVVIQVLHIPGETNYTENIQHQATLKKSIEEQLKNESKSLIKKTQRIFKAEPFLWSSIVRENFWTWTEYEKFDWSDYFSNSKVDIKFDVTIDRYGKYLYSEREKRL